MAVVIAIDTSKSKKVAQAKEGINFSTSPGGVKWALPTISTIDPKSWVDQTIEGAAYEERAKNIFRTFTNLRYATDQLARYITPFWPDSTGRSVLEKAIEAAATATVKELFQGDNRDRRIVGVYLYHLTRAVRDVAKIKVFGRDEAGMVWTWRYLEQPITEWVQDRKIVSLEAIQNETELDDAQIDGLVTCLLARIVIKTDDAGCMTSYAPRG
jgi:hypothetical protein